MKYFYIHIRNDNPGRSEQDYFLIGWPSQKCWFYQIVGKRDEEGIIRRLTGDLTVDSIKKLFVSAVNNQGVVITVDEMVHLYDKVAEG
jgi:hypothetical protein